MLYWQLFAIFITSSRLLYVAAIPQPYATMDQPAKIWVFNLDTLTRLNPIYNRTIISKRRQRTVKDETNRLMYHTHTANWIYFDGNLWDLRAYYAAYFCKSQIFSGHSFCNNIKCNPSRALYNGSTSASQAEDEGSIPFARTTDRTAILAVFFWNYPVAHSKWRMI